MAPESGCEFSHAEHLIFGCNPARCLPSGAERLGRVFGSPESSESRSRRRTLEHVRIVGVYWIAGVFGLAGVLVGGFVQWLLTSAGEKRRARQEARVAARLLLEHFRIAKRTLEGMNNTGWTKGRPDVLFFGNLWDSCSRPLANGIVPIDDYRLVHETVVYLLIIESLQLEGKIPEGTPVKDLPEHLDIGIPGVSKNIGKVEKILSVVAKEERRLRKPWAYLSSLPDRLIYRRGQTG